MIEIVKYILDWLDKNLPKILGAFGLGYKIGSMRKKSLEKELKLKEYENEKLKNEKEVHDSNDGHDVVGEFIDRNRR